MNTADITALITAATALIGAVSGLVILIAHLVKHQAITSDKPVNNPAVTGLINPGITDTHQP